MPMFNWGSDYTGSGLSDNWFLDSGGLDGSYGDTNPMVDLTPTSFTDSGGLDGSYGDNNPVVNGPIGNGSSFNFKDSTKQVLQQLKDLGIDPKMVIGLIAANQGKRGLEGAAQGTMEDLTSAARLADPLYGRYGKYADELERVYAQRLNSPARKAKTTALQGYMGLAQKNPLLSSLGIDYNSIFNKG